MAALSQMWWELDRLGARRAMVIASHSLSRGTASIERLQATLGGRLVGMFDEGAPHTPRSAVLAAATMARDMQPITTVDEVTEILEAAW